MILMTWPIYTCRLNITFWTTLYIESNHNITDTTCHHNYIAIIITAMNVNKESCFSSNIIEILTSRLVLPFVFWRALLLWSLSSTKIQTMPLHSRLVSSKNEFLGTHWCWSLQVLHKVCKTEKKKNANQSRLFNYKQFQSANRE